MNWKEFLKPTKLKIILLIVILIPAMLVQYNEYNCMTMGGGCTHSKGFPFAYHSIKHSAALPDAPPPTEIYNNFFIIPDFVFWYLVVCVLVSLYHKKMGNRIEEEKIRKDMIAFLAPEKRKFIIFFIIGILPFSLFGPFLYLPYDPAGLFVFGLIFLSITYAISCSIIHIYSRFKSRGAAK